METNISTNINKSLIKMYNLFLLKNPLMFDYLDSYIFLDNIKETLKYEWRIWRYGDMQYSPLGEYSTASASNHFHLNSEDCLSG